MRRITFVGGFCFLLGTLPANGGLVLIDPPYFLFDYEHIEYEFEVSVVSDVGSFDSLNIVFGSRALGHESAGLEFGGGVEFVAFEYSAEFRRRAGAFAVTPQHLGIYPNDFYVGGFSPTPMETPFVVGTLTVAFPTTAHVTIGLGSDYFFWVDSSFDGGFSSIGLGTHVEPLRAIGIPEPTTVVVWLTGVGISMLGRTRRRRASRIREGLQ